MSRFNSPRVLSTAPAIAAPRALETRRSAGTSAPPLAPPVAPPVDPQRQANENNALRRLGFWFALGFIFIRFSLIHEFLSLHLGLNLFLPAVFGVPALFLLLASGGLARVFSTSTGIFLTGFMGWLLLITPFSVWPGGTAQLMSRSFQTEFSMLFMTAGLVMTWSELRWVAGTLVVGAAINAFIALKYSINEMGRYAVSFGSLQNPNDLSTHILVLVPFVLLFILDSKASLIKRIVCVAILAGSLFVVVRTSSRGALLALTAMAFLVFIRAKAMQRLLLFAIVLIGGVLVVFTSPQIVTRYLTTFEVTAEMLESQEMTSAIASGNQRKELLFKSLATTLKHPITGVGPGQYATYENDLAVKEGKRGTWLGTHNTYTEISSEAGIPAFILYTGGIITSLLLLRRTYRRAIHDDPGSRAIRAFAFCLSVSLAGFLVCSFFASMAYRYYLYALVGLVISFHAFATHHLNSQATVRKMQPARKF